MKIIELKSYNEKGAKATILSEATFVKSNGIVGDYHNDISILTTETKNWMADKNGLCFKKFKENILLDTDTTDISYIECNDVLLKINPREKFCFKECPYYSLFCPMKKGAFFADVLSSGNLKITDNLSFTSSRYTRNIKSLTVAEQNILHNKKVCVIGTGGLGGYIVEILARIGILNITIVDYDVFDNSNLNRQLFSNENVIDKPKIQVAKERIKTINSMVNINTISDKLTEQNVEQIIKGHDIVMDGLDNIKTRKFLVKACANNNIPFIFGSIAGWVGQVACVYPGNNTIDTVYKGQDQERGIESELGNLPFTASATASLQCAECVKVLLNKGVPIKNGLLHLDLLYGDVNFIQL